MEKKLALAITDKGTIRFLRGTATALHVTESELAECIIIERAAQLEAFSAVYGVGYPLDEVQVETFDSGLRRAVIGARLLEQRITDNISRYENERMSTIEVLKKYEPQRLTGGDLDFMERMQARHEKADDKKRNRRKTNTS